ncbi:hypothetical protein KBD08_03260 [Candidatus Babeliales bacterium]|nr:hypothetical protein [Candidatus Babeliales bacterium]
MFKFNRALKSVFVSVFMMSGLCASEAPLIEKYSLESGHLDVHFAVFVTMHALVSKAQAEGKLEVADFVGKKTFGNDWAVHFEVAKQMHETNGYGNIPTDLMDTACNIIQCALLKKASNKEHGFLRRSFDERLATHMMHSRLR